MIHAYTILTGYVALRGSGMIHLSMFFAMIFYVRVPECKDDCFCEEKIFDDGTVENYLLNAQEFWYRFGLIMHFILWYMNFAVFVNRSDKL